MQRDFLSSLAEMCSWRLAMDRAGLRAMPLHKAARNTWELPEPPFKRAWGGLDQR